MEEEMDIIMEEIRREDEIKERLIGEMGIGPVDMMAFADP